MPKPVFQKLNFRQSATRHFPTFNNDFLSPDSRHSNYDRLLGMRHLASMSSRQRQLPEPGTHG